VVLALYRLLRGVNASVALVMLVLGTVDVPIYFVNTLNDAGALLVARGGEIGAAFAPAQRAAMSALFLDLHHYGVVVNEVFWGLWLFPFGMLVYRSRFLPRAFGVWLMLNCFAYLAQSVSGELAPQYLDMVATVAFPVQFGEIAIMLWLLIAGVRGKWLAAAQA
jgi:hypothetical protein